MRVEDAQPGAYISYRGALYEINYIDAPEDGRLGATKWWVTDASIPFADEPRPVPFTAQHLGLATLRVAAPESALSQND